MKRVRLTNRAALQAEALHRAGSIPKPKDGNGWYRIKNLATGPGNAEVYLYDEIGMWGITASEFVRDLQRLEAVHIDLRINSGGGDVWDGITIYNALCNHPASVTTYIDGLAASSASFIAQAGGKVFIARNGTMMIHDAEGVCIGNAADMIEMAELLDRTSDNIADIYAQRVSTISVWRRAMRNMTWYIGEEAVNAGLADETYEPEQGTEDQPAEKRRRVTTARAGNKRRVSDRVPRPISTACPEHSTGTVDTGTWDETQVDSLPSPVPITTARRVYGWYDGSQVEDGALPREACRFPHHEVDEDGMPGAAHLVAVRDALAELEESGIDDAEKEEVRRHLQGHLDDSESEPEPEPEPEPDDRVNTNPADTDTIDDWWDPTVFKAAVATAADQHNLYGFDAAVFREVMRAASENCPAPPVQEAIPIQTPEPAPAIDTKEFLAALRKGLL